MNKLKKLLINYKEPIAYLIFGILTTLVNIIVYYLFADVWNMHYLLSNIIAWITSVLFAFITNKLFVFDSKSWQGKVVVAEMGSFFFARVATGVLDMVFMWLLIDIMTIDVLFVSTGLAQTISGEMFAKVFVNVIVVILNYIASKLWIFRGHKNGGNEKECN